MINPKDVENKTNEELKEVLPDGMVEELSNGKGDDEDGSNTKVHK
jgi:hypothetical protein